MRYQPISNELFISNRFRFRQCLKPRSVAVFHSNDIMPTSADGIRSFIQDTDLFYLSGIDQEETILMICTDTQDPAHEEILFVRETNAEITIWEGPRLTVQEASDISGIQSVYPLSRFPAMFRNLVCQAEHIYLNTNEHLRATPLVETRNDRFIKECKRQYPLHRYERIAPIMRQLRMLKSDVEIGLIREACRITGNAFRRILAMVRPGIWEFEIEAEIHHEFIRNRSRRPAYEPIVASGPNSCILHSIKNNRQCQDGEVVLMDFGAEYANYAADLTRTIPVNGRFTDRQKAVYNAVLRVQTDAIKMLRPGTRFKDYNEEVGRIMESELIGLGLLDKDQVRQQDPDKPLYKTYFMHGTSHHLGLDVHDVAEPSMPMAAGMILTCEPGIYIPDEHLGIRIENDILITEDGPVDLMADIPITVEEIEELMQSGG